jgi:hypothetical protein
MNTMGMYAHSIEGLKEAFDRHLVKRGLLTKEQAAEPLPDDEPETGEQPAEQTSRHS